MKTQVNARKPNIAGIVGLTGGIASGKSRAASFLQSLGAAIVDADEAARAVVEPGSIGLENLEAKLASTLHRSVKQADGTLDRAFLNAAIFADKDLRLTVEAILHPLIMQHVYDQLTRLKKAAPDAPVMFSAPLLFEKGLEAQCTGVVLIACDEAVQAQRLQARDGFTAQQAAQRIAAQMPLGEKSRRATWVVDNNGSIEELEKRLRQIWPEILERSKAT